MPEIGIPYAGNRYRFLPDGKSVVVFLHRLGQTTIVPPAYHLLDLATGRARRLTNLRGDFQINSFDVSPDGKRILFDRYKENADVVLIDLPRSLRVLLGAPAARRRIDAVARLLGRARIVGGPDARERARSGLGGRGDGAPPRLVSG